MKKLVIIGLVLVLVSFAWANKQGSFSDADRKVHIVAAFDCVSIAADTAITTSGGRTIMAIAPAEDVNVYFGTDDTDKFPITAGQTFAINPNVDVKLDAEVKCLVF